MKVLIGGGTGFIGRHLVKLLTQQGHDYMLLSRSPGPKTITWNDLHRDGLPKECDAVVNLSGKNLMLLGEKWNDNFKSTLISSRVSTTSQLAQAVAASAVKPKAFVAASAIACYQPDDVKEYTEETKVEPYDFFSELVAQWEKSAKLPEDCPTRSVTIRIGLALGRDGGTIGNMYIPFFLGLGGPISTGKQWFPWIHVDDVAGIIIHAIENNHVTGILNAVAPQPLTNAEMTSAFARAMWRPAFFPLPAFVLKCLYGSERASIITEGQKVIPKRTLESGYEFRYPTIDVAAKEFSRLIAIP